MAGMYGAPSISIQKMREEAERKIKLAKRNLLFVCREFNISSDKLASNSNIDGMRLVFLLDSFSDMSLDEFLRLVQTLNVMCDLNFSILDYTTIEFSTGKDMILAF